MAQARTLKKELYTKLRNMLDRISTRLEVDRVILSLSFKAGLRAGEMAGIKWQDVCDPFGKLIQPGEEFVVRGEIAKYGASRSIPMHPELFEDLKTLLNSAPWTKLEQAVIPPARGSITEHVDPNTMQRYIGRLFRKAGLHGLSSHSGRRTFGTTLARSASTEECSLRDVQLLMGHRNLQTTEGYIDYSEGVKRLVTKL